MNPHILFRLGGIALILAGIAYLADTVADELVPGNVFGIGNFVSLFGLYGMMAIFFYQNTRAKHLGLLAFAFNFTGLSGLVAVAFLNNLVLPKLPAETVAEILSGSALAGLIATGVVFLIGGLLMALTVWRTQAFPRASAVLYGLGVIPVALPPLVPALATTIGGVAISVVLIVWGMTLIRNPEPPAAAA